MTTAAKTHRVEKPEPAVEGLKEWPLDHFGYQRATWHGHLLGGVVATYPGAVYVEIGVLKGECWRVAAPFAAEAHGVDVDDCEPYMDGVGRFWHMSSAEFFEVYEGPAPDVVFVDGDHRLPTCSDDVDSALALVAPGGVVVLHDTWPVDLANERLSGQVWTVRKRLERDPSVECFTFPRFPGITLARPL